MHYGDHNDRDSFYRPRMSGGPFNGPNKALSTDKFWIKYKTEYCHHYASSTQCPRKDSCNYAHGESEKRRNPVSADSIDYRPFMAPEHLSEEKKMEFCLNMNEYLFHPENYKTKYCQYSGQGRLCARGNCCANAHFSHELRNPISKDTLPYYARYREWSTVKVALENNPDIDYKYKFTKETALHYAAKYSKADIVEELLRRGANINAKDTQGQTPLFKLVAHNTDNCVLTAKILMDAGASAEMADIHGDSPFSLAYKNKTKNMELLRILDPTQKLMKDCLRNQILMGGLGGGLKRHHPESSPVVEPAPKRVKVEALPKPVPRTIECKFEDATVTVPVEPNSVKSLRDKIFSKLEKPDRPDINLKYIDEEGDEIDLEDAEDFEIFYENDKVQHLTLKRSAY